MKTFNKTKVLTFLSSKGYTDKGYIKMIEAELFNFSEDTTTDDLNYWIECHIYKPTTAHDQAMGAEYYNTDIATYKMYCDWLYNHVIELLKYDNKLSF